MTQRLSLREARSVLAEAQIEVPDLDRLLNGDLSAPRTLSAHPQLRPDARFGLAGEVVAALEPHTEADPAGLLVSLLAMAGNAIGSGAYAVADAAMHPPRLSVVLVGDTSRSRKGTAEAQSRSVMEDADPGWASDRVMGGLASGEGLIAAVRDGEGQEDQGVTDKRLLVVEPEFSRVLAVGGREGNTLSSVIRHAWDDGRLRVMTRRDPLRATGAHVSILGHITREELLRRLSDTEAADGFANRFLFICVRRSRLLPSGGHFADEARRSLGQRLGVAIQRARRIGRVHRTPEAETLWAELYAEMAEGPGGLVGAITARAEAQALRLSLTYALLDGSPAIDVPHLKAAYALWQYAEESARYIFGDATGDHIADRILAALRDAGPEGMDREGLRDLFSRHVSAKRLDLALSVLERSGLLMSRTEETGGRPRTIYCAVSDVSAERSRQ